MGMQSQRLSSLCDTKILSLLGDLALMMEAKLGI